MEFLSFFQYSPVIVIPEKSGIQPRKKLKPSMFMKLHCVYILANKRNGTLYIGVTSDLERRVWEHKNKVVKGFSKKYDTEKLVYYEQGESMIGAIQREKQLKKWNRKWKLELIEKENPDWIDLYPVLFPKNEARRELSVGSPLSRG